MTQIRLAVTAAVAAWCLWPASAAAQTWETVGTRAQGMAGAFVAVADDATATWWNPAGLATGAFFNAVLERGAATDPATNIGFGPAWRGGSTGFAVAFPALGLSYYRLRISEIAPATSTGEEGAARQDEGAGGLRLRTLGTTQFGVTTGQSIGRHLVVASTLKLVRAGRVSRVALESEGGETALEDAAELDEPRDTTGAIDVGAMASIGRLRLGVSVRNLNEPSFGEGESEFELERQARAGLSVFLGRAALVDGVLLALDADLTTTDTAVGESRRVAGGGEVWLFNRRLGVRGGASVNTLDGRRTAASAGFSVAPRAGFYLDGAITSGSDASREGWNLGVRVTF